MTKMITHVKIRSRIWKTMVLLTIWTVVASAVVTVAEQPPGFISIDCGSATQYQDSLTSLTWETDGKYIQTGKNGKVPIPPDSTTDNYEALRTFRYFPGLQSKCCYELPIAKDSISILIRAMFLHGKSSSLVLPTSFSVYVNGTLWTNVQYGSDDEQSYGSASKSDANSPKVFEGIFYSPGKIVYICLVPWVGTPFISSLEVRQLDPGGVMYNFTNRQKLLLSNLVRYNIGASTSAPTVRHPDDAYDRLWTNPGYEASGISITSREENANTSLKWNSVPPRVMMDAAFESPGSPLSFSVTPTPTTASSYVYAIFYCQALNNTEGLNMVISLNEEETAPFNVTQTPVLRSFTNVIFAEGDSQVEVSSPSGFGAIVNALEVYEEILLDTTATNTDDVSLASFLTTTFNLSDWKGLGDPCVPVPYDGIKCTSKDDSDYVDPEIVSLYLSNLTDNDRLQHSASLMGYTLKALCNVSITQGYVENATLQFLTDTYFANSPNLYSLNFSYNSLTSIPDLSTVQNLTVLDLSHNSISSTISSVYSLMFKLSKEIHLSDNHLRGIFPSDPYFSLDNLPDLKLLNVDRNNISGLLNLTVWYRQLQDAVSNSSLNGQVPDRVYSLVDNDISDIIPNADDFQLTIEFLMKNNSHFNETGVLLGGNPYCNTTKSMTHRYLCRSTVNDVVYENPENPKKRNHYILIIFATMGGVIFFSLCSILLTFTINWKLRQQLSIKDKFLQEVQQELLSKKVHPLFFDYQDLKLATRNFHRDNRLGSGAFAEVYKGILSDGSIVAVKRHFNHNKEHLLALHEFCNEVRLISGIKHKNLIQLKGCCINDEERILVYEFAENGSLAESLWGKHTDKLLDWTHRLNVAKGVARGLSYLHEELQPRIIHRDIKALNILLDDNLNAKIADFGLAKPFDEDDTHAQFTNAAGTWGYCAPEYVLDRVLTAKADVFSFGILLLEIVAGRKCIDSTLSSDRCSIKNWAEDLQKSGTLLELLQLELRDSAPEQECIKIINIALSCIQFNPKSRPTMSQVVVLLLGNLEVQIFLNEDGTSHEEGDINFDSLYEGTSMSSGLKYRPTGVTYEDSEEVPFAKSLSFPLSILGTSRTESPHIRKLSSMKGS